MMQLRSMVMSDLPQVLSIIEAHDDDDAEAAEADYHEAGFDNQFVFEDAGIVVGVTGFREVDATDFTAWLSWTYLAESSRGKGQGKAMLTELIEILRARGGRKLFLKLSDYKEDGAEFSIYESAHHAYKSVGFETELVGENFYDEGENQIIMGLYLNGAPEQKPEIADEKPVIRFNGLHEIAESDGAYTFEWTVQDKSLFSKRSFSVPDLRVGLESVQEREGRKVFLTFPANLPLIHKPLQAAGFKFVGRLTDYYESGLDELHFSHDLSPTT